MKLRASRRKETAKLLRTNDRDPGTGRRDGELGAQKFGPHSEH